MPIIDSGTNVDRAISSEGVRLSGRSLARVWHTLDAMKSWLILVIAALGGAGALPAMATAASGPADAREQIRQFVAAEVARAEPGLRAEIVVGDIDPRLHLASCAHPEAFLRAGARLWGRSFVGYRCLQHPGWSISVPVQVSLYGPALVAAQSLPVLQPISATALRTEEIEVTREPGGVVTRAEQLEDRICTRGVDAGQPIPLNALRTVPAVGQGDAVKLVGSGNGFSISTDAVALATVAAGEMVRVRVESGRTVSGIARKGRIVEVSF
jgi:flagella basal body P-ring formation protein FlgA